MDLFSVLLEASVLFQRKYHRGITYSLIRNDYQLSHLVSNTNYIFNFSVMNVILNRLVFLQFLCRFFFAVSLQVLFSDSLQVVLLHILCRLFFCSFFSGYSFAVSL